MTRKPGRKSTAQEVAARKEWLEGQITTKGWSMALCRTFERRFNLSQRQAYREAKAILDDLEEVHDSISTEARRAIARERLGLVESVLFREFTREAGKSTPNEGTLGRVSKNLVYVMRTSARIDGLYAPRQVELSGPNGGPIEVSHPSPEEYAAIAARLLGGEDSASAKGE